MRVRVYDAGVQRFIESLEKPTIAKVLRTIDLLEEFGSRLGMPHTKKIVGDLFELRIRGTQEVRILYAIKKGEAVLLHGFIKKRQKIQSREIETALARLRRLD